MSLFQEGDRVILSAVGERIWPAFAGELITVVHAAQILTTNYGSAGSLPKSDEKYSLQEDGFSYGIRFDSWSYSDGDNHTCSARCLKFPDDDEEIQAAIASIVEAQAAQTKPVDQWRDNRESGWYTDIGYALEGVLRKHQYNYKATNSKPDDPGWHACTCGDWEGYWSDFEPHVADHLRALVKEKP